MTERTVRLQLDLRDFPAAARERLYRIASEQTAGTGKRVTLTDVCRDALVAFATPTHVQRRAVPQPTQAVNRERPPWER
jgi:hypothetical protein